MAGSMTKPEIDAEGLLPCPFCGATDISASNVGEDEDNWFVGCMNRGCAVNPCVFHPDSEAEAIAAWNRRAATRTSEAEEPVAWGPLFTYQRTFDAIAAAVTPNAVGLGISVKKFIEAFGPVAAPQPSPVSEEGTAKPVGMRVCPERDSLCPHGHDCAFSIDRYHCNMVGSRDALASIWSTKP